MQVAGLPRDGGLLSAAHLSRKSSVVLIGSGAPWCVAGESENNAQATRAESAQTVLIKTAQATPETDREPAFGERWGVTTE